MAEYVACMLARLHTAGQDPVPCALCHSGPSKACMQACMQLIHLYHLLLRCDALDWGDVGCHAQANSPILNLPHCPQPS